MNAEMTSSHITVYAIPVYDGSLIASEHDLLDAISELGEMSVDLINDFEVAWAERKTVNYPKYRRRLKLRRNAGGEDGDSADGDDVDDGGDEDQEEDQEEEEENDSES